MPGAQGRPRARAPSRLRSGAEGSEGTSPGTASEAPQGDGFIAEGALEAEEGLELVPDREPEEDRVGDERGEEGPVALPGAPPLAVALHARPPPRPLEGDVSLERGGRTRRRGIGLGTARGGSRHGQGRLLTRPRWNRKEAGRV